jgi:hypothetical protein
MHDDFSMALLLLLLSFSLYFRFNSCIKQSELRVTGVICLKRKISFTKSREIGAIYLSIYSNLDSSSRRDPQDASQKEVSVDAGRGNAENAQGFGQG